MIGKLCEDAPAMVTVMAEDVVLVLSMTHVVREVICRNSCDYEPMLCQS